MNIRELIDLFNRLQSTNKEVNEEAANQAIAEIEKLNDLVQDYKTAVNQLTIHLPK